MISEAGLNSTNVEYSGPTWLTPSYHLLGRPIKSTMTPGVP